MSDTQAPTPAAVKGGVTPYLMVDGAIRAAELYVKVLGAEIAGQHPPDDKGRTMHVHLYVNGTSVMLGDPFPEHGAPLVPPQAFNLMLRTPEAKALFDRAVAAGFQVRIPFGPQFWGDDYGMVQDPFGVTWAFSTPAN